LAIGRNSANYRFERLASEAVTAKYFGDFGEFQFPQMIDFVALAGRLGGIVLGIRLGREETAQFPWQLPRRQLLPGRLSR
jgi:hypothetical protein